MLGNIVRQMIAEPVGNNFTNRDSDVRRVKRAFSYMNRFEEPEQNGLMTRELDTSIRVFQRDLGLREDGFLRPGGETERSINLALNTAPLFGLKPFENKSHDADGSEGGESDDVDDPRTPPLPPSQNPPSPEDGDDEKQPNCEDLEVKVANASGAFVIAEQKLNSAQIELTQLNERLNELNQKIQRERETGRNMRIAGGVTGGFVGAVTGGILGAPGGPAASVGGAMALGGRGIGVGSTGAVAGEEIGDEITGEGSLIRLEIQKAALKKELEALKEKIKVLKSELRKAKINLHQAQQELHQCQKGNKR